MNTTTEKITGLALAPALPHPLRVLARALPAYPGSLALALGVNVVLRPQLPGSLLEALEGKLVAIEVKDLETTFALRVVRGTFQADRSGAAPSMKFRANAYDFAAIAAGQEDADALFFRRRLMVEGDTELALEAKNALDSLDMPLFRRGLGAVLKVIAPLFGRAS
jgi:predicted lipid carrier protein YhbT